MPVKKPQKKVEEDTPNFYEGLSDEQYNEFMAREADIITQCVWVAKYLDVPESRLRILDAPCAEAWSLLMDARRNSGRRADFIEKVYAKLIPSRSALDGMKPGQQDGGHIIETINRLLAIHEQVKKEMERGLPTPGEEGDE